jgi:hypothetical protein
LISNWIYWYVWIWSFYSKLIGIIIRGKFRWVEKMFNDLKIQTKMYEFSNTLIYLLFIFHLERRKVFIIILNLYDCEKCKKNENEFKRWHEYSRLIKILSISKSCFIR